MSEEDQDNDSKEYDASPQKLVEARKRGDIPRSVDLLTAASTAGQVVALAGFGSWAFMQAGSAGMVVLDQSEQLSRLMTEKSSGPLGGMMLSVAGPPLALLGGPAMLVLALLLATRGIKFTPERVLPKLSRLSLVGTAKQKFGPEGLVEFAKSAVKLGLVSALLYGFLALRFEEMMATVYLDPALSMAVLARLTVEFLVLILLVALFLGGADYLWQIYLLHKRNRMSRKEMMDEFKESEGDPHIKAARRQRAQEVAANRMLADVQTADVVMVNPKHYAVALRWDRGKGAAPVCVAKGMDELARVIRERAAQHGVPIHSDPPAARALFATVDIGQEIRVEHFRAVAAAIRFADAMRRKARQR